MGEFNVLLVTSQDQEKTIAHLEKRMSYHFRELGQSLKLDIESSCEASFNRIHNSTKEEYDLFIFNTKEHDCFARFATEYMKLKKDTSNIFKILISSHTSNGINNTIINNRDHSFHTDTNTLQIKPEVFSNREKFQKILRTFVTHQPKICISYGNDPKNTARDIIDEFMEYSKIAVPQMHIFEDRKELRTGMKIYDFFAELGSGDIIILIINDRYFESESAMRELCEIFNKLSGTNKVFPLIVPTEKDFYDVERYNEILNFWDEKLERIEKTTRVSRRIDPVIAEEIEKIHEFLSVIPKLRLYAKNFFTLPISEYQKTRYLEIFEKIYQTLDKEKYVHFYKNEEQIETSLNEYTAKCSR